MRPIAETLHLTAAYHSLGLPTDMPGKCLDLCHFVVTIKVHVTFPTVDYVIREA